MGVGGGKGHAFDQEAGHVADRFKPVPRDLSHFLGEDQLAVARPLLLVAIQFPPDDRRTYWKIGRAHVCTPVTNAHLVCSLLLEKKKTIHYSPHLITSES